MMFARRNWRGRDDSPVFTLLLSFLTVLKFADGASELISSIHCGFGDHMILVDEAGKRFWIDFARLPEVERLPSKAASIVQSPSIVISDEKLRGHDDDPGIDTIDTNGDGSFTAWTNKPGLSLNITVSEMTAIVAAFQRYLYGR